MPWRRGWLRTPVFFSGEFHGQGSLAGYILWFFNILVTLAGHQNDDELLSTFKTNLRLTVKRV